MLKCLPKKLASLNKRLTFCFLSGMGSDRKEKSRVPFAKSKGMAENLLISLNFQHLHIFRPAYIYPIEPRKEPNLMYKIMRKIYKPIFPAIYPDFGIDSDVLAKVMVEVGFSNSPKMIFENRDIRKYNLQFDHKSKL